MRDILLDAPLPYVALALTVVVVAAALMYRVDRGNRHLPGALRAALGLARTATLAVLVLLLFQPVLRIEESTTRQPALLILQDRSLSIGSEDPEWGSTFQAWVDGLPTTAGTPGAAVELYGFGSEPLALERLDDTLYSDPTTDLSAALDAVRGQWAGAPIGAVVIATDGRFNRGRSPEAEGQRIPAPLHVITLGDTSLKKMCAFSACSTMMWRVGATPFPSKSNWGLKGTVAKPSYASQDRERPRHKRSTSMGPEPHSPCGS